MEVVRLFVIMENMVLFDLLDEFVSMILNFEEV